MVPVGFCVESEELGIRLWALYIEMIGSDGMGA
jgi:hypothetical protein